MTVMWSILSVLFVLALWGMQTVLGRSRITFSIGQWVGYVAWLLWTLFGIALVWTFVDEGKPRAVGVGVSVFGGVSVIAAVVLASLWIFP